MIRFEKFIKAFLKILGNAFFTHRCHSCDKVTDFGEIICPECFNRLKDVIGGPRIVTDTRFKHRIFTLSSYDSFAADVIKIIKYRPSLKLLHVLTGICKEKSELYSFFDKKDIIVPVPMHKKRKEKRGFNQAEELAKDFADIIGCNYSDVIVRTVFRKPQAECNEAERLKNLDNSLGINKNAILSAFKGKRLILVDDVATTGTTLQKCANELEKLQPREIVALTVAHSYKQ